MATKTTVSGLSEAIMSAMSEYGEEVTEDTRAAVKAVTTQCRKDIQARSPKDTGEYQRGWTTKVSEESPTYIRGIVYNKRKPGLAHLLEDGHAKVGGGRVEGKQHIAPAEEAATEELLKRMKEAAKR